MSWFEFIYIISNGLEIKADELIQQLQHFIVRREHQVQTNQSWTIESEIQWDFVF